MKGVRSGSKAFQAEGIAIVCTRLGLIFKRLAIVLEVCMPTMRGPHLSCLGV